MCFQSVPELPTAPLSPIAVEEELLAAEERRNGPVLNRHASSQSDLALVHFAPAHHSQVNRAPADVVDIDCDRYYREIVLPDKLSMNLRYLDRISLSHDLWLLFRTTVAIFTPHLYAIHEDHSPR